LGGATNGEGRAGVDYYALLGVPPAASVIAVRAAFRRMAKRLHPDTSTLPHAAERFRLIVEACDVLTDPARRLAYDATYQPASVQHAGEGAASGAMGVPRGMPGGTAGGLYGPTGTFVAYTTYVPQGPSAAASERNLRRIPPVPAPSRAVERGVRAKPRPPKPGPGSAGAPPRGRPARPSTAVAAVTAVTAVAPIGAVGPASRTRRMSPTRHVPAARVACTECGVMVAAGMNDLCSACARKYGSFQDHLARAAAARR